MASRILCSAPHRVVVDDDRGYIWSGYRQPAAVVVSNSEANGYVLVDAVQWLPK